MGLSIELALPRVSIRPVDHPTHSDVTDNNPGDRGRSLAVFAPIPEVSNTRGLMGRRYPRLAVQSDGRVRVYPSIVYMNPGLVTDPGSAIFAMNPAWSCAIVNRTFINTIISRSGSSGTSPTAAI